MGEDVLAVEPETLLRELPSIRQLVCIGIVPTMGTHMGYGIVLLLWKLTGVGAILIFEFESAGNHIMCFLPNFPDISFQVIIGNVPELAAFKDESLILRILVDDEEEPSFP